MNILNLSAQQLKHAADLKERITELERELQSVLGGGGEAPSPVVRAGKYKMSAAGRARIIAAQKARWAKFKGSTAASAPVKRRTMSPAARARIAAAAKARWAKAKKAGKNSL